MNILLVNHYAGTPTMGMEFRPFYIAREAKKLGHTVTIIGASYSHLRKVQPKFSGSYQKETIDGIEYIWLKTPKYEGNGVKRFINMLTFVAQLFRFLPQICREMKPDAVIASSTYPLDFIATHKAARACGAQSIFELHDLWPLSPIELGGMSPKHPFIRLMQWGEDYWCKHCDKVISILPHADKHLVTRGLDPQKFYHVPNGVVLEDWKNSTQPPQEYIDFFNAAHAKGEFLVGYTGAHGVANALDTLIDAAKELQNTNIRIVLVGRGQEKENLKRKVVEEKLQNVTFLNPVEKKCIPNLLQFFDCLYMGAKKNPLYQYGMSFNKSFDYLMSGKIVINGVESSNDIVKESQCGISILSENVRELSNAMKSIKEKDQNTRENIGKRGKQYILEKHTYTVLAQHFITIIGKK